MSLSTYHLIAVMCTCLVHALYEPKSTTYSYL